MHAGAQRWSLLAVEKTTVSVQASYEKMRDALNKTGRPILYSLCSWGSGQPWLWGKDVSAGLQGCMLPLLPTEYISKGGGPTVTCKCR
jgi:hypothetical protein